MEAAGLEEQKNCLLDMLGVPQKGDHHAVILQTALLRPGQGVLASLRTGRVPTGAFAFIIPRGNCPFSLLTLAGFHN